MKTEHSLIARSVNTFIPLGDETINSSLEERGRSLMDPQLHPLLHFLVQMKSTSGNVFLEVAKNVEVTRKKIWAVWRMTCFPAISLKVIPHQIGSMGMGIIMQNIIPSDSIPGRFDFVAPRSTLSYQEMNCIPLLFFVCLHFQLRPNTLYTTLTIRAITKQLYGTVRFHYE